MTYYVAVYRPAYPDKGVKTAVYRESEYSLDVLPPTVTAVWRVEYVKTKQEAIALVLEKFALPDRPIMVHRIL